jgi:TRAP-type C4-dicarboxylate transport system substrate-binding protein
MRAAMGLPLIAGLMVAMSASAQDYTFKLHHFLGPTTPTQTETIEPWARAVEANSGGRVAIEIYPSMSLGGKPAELVQQARDGVVDLVWTVNGYTPGLFPRTEVFELPNVFTNDPGATNLAMADMFAEDLAPEYGGLEVMFLHVHAGNGIHTVDRDVRAPSDLAGAKLRIPSRTGAWVIEALGAAPVAMPVPDLPQALSKGVVDGALIPFEITLPLKLQDQTKFHVEGADRYRFGTTVFQLSMNAERWNALPEDIRQAFRDASGPDWLARLGRIWRGTDDAATAELVAAGNTHVELAPEQVDAFRAALEPVIDRWIADVSASGVDGAPLVSKARERIAAHASDGS